MKPSELINGRKRGALPWPGVGRDVTKLGLIYRDADQTTAHLGEDGARGLQRRPGGERGPPRRAAAARKDALRRGPGRRTKAGWPRPPGGIADVRGGPVRRPVVPATG